MEWYLGVLKKYAVFDGRAQRKEYWMFVLFNLIIVLLLGFIDGILGFASSLDISVLTSIYSLAIIVPSIAVGVRRLHDTNKSGWWMLLSLIPFIGALVLLIFMIQDSNPESNRFGANPKVLQAVVVERQKEVI